MKSRLFGIAAVVFMAGGLSQCTHDYMNGKASSAGEYLRPGETPLGSDQRIPPNDTAATSGDSLEAAAPNGPENWRIDPNAPKQSNGGSGSELSPGSRYTFR